VISYFSQVLQTYFSERGFLGLVEHSFEIRCQELLTMLEKFEEDAPFTVQRLAEVLTNPSQYQSTHKLMNCLEKLLSVTLTVPARP
jgi:PPP4R2